MSKKGKIDISIVESLESSDQPSSILPSIKESNEQIGNYCDYNMEDDYRTSKCTHDNQYNNDCNKFFLKKELVERKCLDETPDENSYLYPSLNDKLFNVKIAEKKEFFDTKYDGTIHEKIKEHANKLANAEFELSPHQVFVKNFLSFQTPYNSLLLYHGLGSGKTCSAIGVCEEMRDYLKQIGSSKRIIIVASENVQDNFRLQLFDERKLKLVDGLWNIRACTGNKLLKEINPMNMAGMTKDKIVSQIKSLINNSYLFLGYGQFANYIIKIIRFNEEERITQREQRNQLIKEKKGKKNKEKVSDDQVILNKQAIKRLRNEFDGRLIVIDEVHNIRITDDNENKKVALYLEKLVKSVNNLRLLLLSATPMYNSYKEIIWLLNLMNINDRRAKVDVKDIFNKDGKFKEGGEDLLIRKATGYISFVRGENPYTFPYRVYPNIFAPENTFPAIKYPNYQMNGKKISKEDKKRILSLYLNKLDECNNCGECQGCAYKYIIYTLKNKSFSITTKKGVVKEMPSFQNMESFGYTLLQLPLESLIISYPHDDLKDVLEDLPETQYSEESEDSPTASFKNDSLKSTIPSSLIEGEENQEVSEIPHEEQDSISTPNTLVNVKNSIHYETKSDRTKVSTPTTVSKKTNKSIKQYPENYSEHTLVDSNKKGGQTSSSKVSSSERISVEIDPHELTGQKGLERMMDYVVEVSPPQKGSFEYKKSIENKYGKIFSQKVIGKYSTKIKTILDNIYSPETDRVSEGVILIYSQYIDGGLIPVALALEEMGFTRYGDNTKPLFKNRPSEIVDVITMKPPADKKKFMPARYSMITGDPRLSPNNDFEVKGLTNDDNKYGNKVKVVLVSRAGSEGIDLKFIRQIHVLEPWYNLNRIEQIIGRGVRNFSHKDLDFEKRNTQIFLYGTIIGENKEEAADLYVYRVAEFKAIQMGRVSRVLKETAVDCIINHDQVNFTQKNINKQINGTITQKLSTGFVDTKFKIGDMPFSSACDYMETCEYSCRPDKKIDEENLNEDTYDEKFIMINSEKILQKIRFLMKQSFFYKKDVLIDLINTQKKYPYVQIYAALTQLIEDNNEVIIDKYDRPGHLVNIGEYYLFQPSELRNKNVSIFERSVPIDFKHSMIDFQLNQDILKPVIDKRNVGTNLYNENEGVVRTNGKKIFDELKTNYELAIEYSGKNKSLKDIKKEEDADDIWFKYAGIVMRKMKKDYPESDKYLLELLSNHLVETVMFNDKVDLINYLYSLENIDEDSFEWFLRNYFERNSMKIKKMIFIIFYDVNNRKIMILNNDTNEWVEAEPEDEIVVDKTIKDKEKDDDINYNEIVGFIGYEKNNKYLVFKTKDVFAKRNKGARCDEAGKEKTMIKLNKIIGKEIYTKESTKAKKNKSVVLEEAVGQFELCVLQEFILRFFNKINKDGKTWFTTPEMAILEKF
jgi:hypothetical protein